MNPKIICFDMDGTIADLYNVPNWLEMLREDREMAKTPYVVENKKGEPMSIRTYQHLFESLTKQAGVRELNFHALRHTFATRAIECGMDIKTVSDLMGHQNASVTLNCYAHCMLDHKRQMVKKLISVL